MPHIIDENSEKIEIKLRHLPVEERRQVVSHMGPSSGRAERIIIDVKTIEEQKRELDRRQTILNKYKEALTERNREIERLKSILNESEREIEALKTATPHSEDYSTLSHLHSLQTIYLDATRQKLKKRTSDLKIIIEQLQEISAMEEVENEDEESQRERATDE